MTSMPPFPPAAPPPTDVPPGGWAAPLPPAPPSRPPLRRSRGDRVLSGVCGGLAEYTGIDALLWRVGAIALTLAGGSGVLVYVLLWLLMPAAPAGSAPAVPSAPAAPRVARLRSPVPGVTLAALLLVAGVATLLAQFTDLDVDASVVVGAALLVVGIGLVVAAVTGAGRPAKAGLVVLGLVLSLALVAASSDRVEVHGGVGDHTYRPTTAADVRDQYDGGVGDLTLDLTAVPIVDLDAPIVTSVVSGVGDVDVLVPAAADVRVVVESGLGDVDVLTDEAAHGGVYPGTGSSAWTADGRPEFRIMVHSGVGDVEVSRG